MSFQKRPTPPRHKTYFFSDVHLGLGTKDDDRKREQRVIRFLDMVKNDGRELFILGDLFDYWFEYKSVVPKGYFRLFSKLSELRYRGIQISYLAGNHDFWLKTYLSDELGIRIFTDPFEQTIGGKKFYLHHGDGLLRKDTGYRILKRILRNRFNIFLFSLVHPDLASAIARWSSRKSRAYTSNKVFEGNDMVEFAKNKIAEGFDVVIMGHNHQPVFRELGRGVYVNIGDWIHEYTYAVFDGNKIQLKKWGEPVHHHQHRQKPVQHQQPA
ncbi:MAG TPA: UDP-2,3-diacylglucosamine diphosphatase [Bacteroidota bacterium]|nr:UDP-2,3-diacylglucosamine diphosphatase [Bacteroidota bacterium]